MAKVRRRVKKAQVKSPQHSSTSQTLDESAELELSPEEQEQSKRFLIILGLVFLIFLLLYAILQVVS